MTFMNKKIILFRFYLPCVFGKELLLITALLLLLGNSVFSQNIKAPEVGNWTMFFGQLRFHEKWSIHAEAQYRDYGIIAEPEQILLRSGVNFHYSSNAMLSAGYGRITNYMYDYELIETPVASENRIWQQGILKNNIGRAFFEHRYRLEQRLIHSNDNTRYIDRIRYLMRVTVPLNKIKVEKNAFFLSFYDEVFIHFSNSPFDRNRLYAAMGYQLSDNCNFQLGYLAQTVNSRTNSYLQLALFYNLKFKKEE